MGFEIPFLEELGKAFLPKSFRPKMREFLSKAGIYKSQYRIVGILFYISFLLTAVLFFSLIYPFVVDFISKTFSKNIGLLILGLSLFLFWAITHLFFMSMLLLAGYFYLDLKIYKRTREIENSLADFLLLVSTNLKGGMGLESALWNAIKPKFGVLSYEITLVSKKVMTGSEVSEALAEFAEKYPSPELKRTLGLIISEFEIGGKISDIIDDIVENLKNTHKLKQELIASVVSYVIFISAIVLFIAPVLFALSYNLISFISGFIAKVGVTLSSSNVPSFLSNISTEGVDPQRFKIFGFFAIGTISFISSMIVSIIQRGEIRAGIKYVPVFVIVAIIVYMLALKFLSIMLGGVVI